MGQTVYKYELDVNDVQSIYMPKGAEVLTVQLQHGRPMLWALVEPSQGRVKEERIFETYGTGAAMDACTARDYVGTYQMMSGSLVFHVFERVQS